MIDVKIDKRKPIALLHHQNRFIISDITHNINKHLFFHASIFINILTLCKTTTIQFTTIFPSLINQIKLRTFLTVCYRNIVIF